MKNLLLAAAATVCSLSLSAQTYSATNVGAGCGPVLDVSFTPVGANGNHTIAIDVSGMDPSGIGLMVWGDTAIQFPLFGCTAWTNFIWGHNVNPDANGEYAWSRSWPSSAIGSFRIQIAALSANGTGGLDVTLSNCVLASCSL